MSGVAYFPAFAPDELIYSTVGRYQRSAATEGLDTKRQFFGTPTLSTALPGHLARFVSQLPAGSPDIDALIERHTIFPYFSPFLSRECWNRTRARMRDEDAGAVKLGLGVIGSRIKDVRWLRLCLACVEEQCNDGREPYWSRKHQLPGVWLCPRHDRPLVDRCQQCGPFHHRSADFALPGLCCPKCGTPLVEPSPPRASPRFRAASLRFAEASTQLLDANLPPMPRRVLDAAYQHAMDARSFPAQQRRAKLGAQVRARWEDEFLGYLVNAPTEQFELPRVMFHEIEATTHPAIHLLVIETLFASFDAFANALARPAAAIAAGAIEDPVALLQACQFDVVEAAKASGVDLWQFAQLLYAQGVAVGRYYGHKDARRRAVIAAGLRAAAPIPDIAKVAAVSVETVYRKLKADKAVGRQRERVVHRDDLDERRALFAQWVRSAQKTKQRNERFSYRALYHYLYYNDRAWLEREVARARRESKRADRYLLPRRGEGSR